MKDGARLLYFSCTLANVWLSVYSNVVILLLFLHCFVFCNVSGFFLSGGAKYFAVVFYYVIYWSYLNVFFSKIITIIFNFGKQSTKHYERLCKCIFVCLLELNF